MVSTSQQLVNCIICQALKPLGQSKIMLTHCRSLGKGPKVHHLCPKNYDEGKLTTFTSGIIYFRPRYGTEVINFRIPFLCGVNLKLMIDEQGEPATGYK